LKLVQIVEYGYADRSPSHYQEDHLVPVMATLDIYSHVGPGMQRDATDRLAHAIDR
jgi:hypothetical protein